MYKWTILLCTWNIISQLFCCCCSLNHIRLCNPRDCSMPDSLSPTICQSVLKPMSIESMMPSNHLILCRPLLLCLQSFPASRSFPESALRIKWPKCWSFSFRISPSNEYSGLIFFRIDEFDLLTVHGTLRSLLQHHNSKASILLCSAFFMVQLSHPYMTSFDHMDVCQQSDMSAF